MYMEPDADIVKAIEGHYRTFGVKKKSGGYRTISAPDDDLKFAQKQMLWELERRVRVSPFAHGFVVGRNSVTAAMPHVRKKLVINIDIKDFFPSVERKFVMNALVRQIGTDDPLAAKVYKWCFIPVSSATSDEQSTGTHKRGLKWGLPQGAPTSPFLSNLAMMNVDWRIARYITSHYENADYTRYADDLTVSADDENVRTVIGVIDGYLHGLGMRKNDKKVRIMRPHRRQEVCGIVVNEKINLPRNYRKLLRAMKHRGNYSVKARGHYSYHHGVYEIEYKPECYRTARIMDAWKVQKKLSDEGDD